MPLLDGTIGVAVEKDNLVGIDSTTSYTAPTGKQITVRLAQFARFDEGRVNEFCSIIDTLGAAEQVLGRPLIEVPAPALAD